MRNGNLLGYPKGLLDGALYLPMDDLEPTPLKICSCGHAYTVSAWERLPLLPPVESDEESIEVRVCECGESLQLVVAAVLAPPLPDVV
jgi:hypothetical protein